MKNTANTRPDKYSEELESLLDLDLSSKTVDPDSTEHRLSDENLTLDNQVSEESISEILTETVTALPLPVKSMPFSIKGKRPLAIANSMAQATNLENLYQITVTELRQQFATDRALIYQFQSAAHGTVIAEALTPGYRPVLGQAIAALTFGAANIESYEQQAIINVTDTAAAAITPYQMQLYQHLQVQATLSLPIFLEDRLWGLLVLQTCAAPRQWTHREIALLYQVGTELTLKLQAHALQQQGQQEVVRERLLTGLVNNIRNSADIQQVLESTTRTIRH